MDQDQKLRIWSPSHAAVVRAIFACSGLGPNVYLMNAWKRPSQRRAVDAAFVFQFCIYDPPMADYSAESDCADRALPCIHASGVSLNGFSFSVRPQSQHRGRRYGGNGEVLTGRTTGVSPAAARKPSILDFIPPFLGLLTSLEPVRSQRIFIVTPGYHGFGLASVFLGVLHGAEMPGMQRFDAVEPGRGLQQAGWN